MDFTNVRPSRSILNIFALVMFCIYIVLFVVGGAFLYHFMSGDLIATDAEGNKLSLTLAPPVTLITSKSNGEVLQETFTKVTCIEYGNDPDRIQSLLLNSGDESVSIRVTGDPERPETLSGTISYKDGITSNLSGINRLPCY